MEADGHDQFAGTGSGLPTVVSEWPVGSVWTILTHKMGYTAQDVAEDDMNRLADQFNISGQANKNNAKPVAAVEPATGWDDETQSAVDGLPNVEGELVDEGESES